MAHTVEDSPSSRTLLGFWMYLTTDGILFGTLFATYAVLKNSTFGGPTIQEVAGRSSYMLQTLFLLFSSFTVAMSGLFEERKKVAFWLVLTGLLGLAFFIIDMADWKQLIQAGITWQKSAFLSAYFTLIGTHVLHIIAGLIWLIVMSVIVLRRGLSEMCKKRLCCLRMFWLFLNFIWVFVLTFVYFLGV